MSLTVVKALKPRIKEMRFSLYLLNRNKLTRLSLIIVLALLVMAMVAPLIVPYPQHISLETNPHDKLLAPSAQYFFGTDELGRDIFSRVLYGTRISLQTALLAVGLALCIGIPLGAIAGFFGGFIDELIMRITDIFLSFPPLLLAITIAAFMGPSLHNAMLAIALSWWPWYTRLIRGQAVSIRERQFVKAARAIGTPPFKIIFNHIVPNCIAPVIVQASMDIGGVILTIASLSFLGLGAQPPTPDWGLMVSTSRNYFLNAWWYSIFPGLAIFITVLVFNLLGDGLREIMDPKTRKL
ncbi:binding-protein-dependent transport systems inner membrane component [Desulforamulus reducens MI-1]|uniref:Binding-protein-dependent transport systems inner membrane component n=1 Tax=Desulforamulus reducens (strain ATCC BAA-1160 / DSM 100696 / MI-1) TaxID=349161 RepID=A4J1I6_DESRM|nr:nickel transporter permease [Desulforamulus reducens]ABO48939.1 binding-protein-dependent transport systems inner membrane component [Desulforamulus reducens MI-1]